MDDSPTKPPRDRSADSPPADDTIAVGERAESNNGNDEGEPAVDQRPKYRSWKKKWRKLRITFDQKGSEAEVLWNQEQKAKATIKRIAIENDRLLDLLADINASAQIPPEKRISIPSSESHSPDRLPKSLSALESDVPHLSLDRAKNSLPHFLTDVTPVPGEDDPAPFLTVDEVENYLFEVDRRLGLPRLPSLAPASREDTPRGGGPPASSFTSSSTRDFMLRHPHSAYNWLKLNAPHVFLQGDDEEGSGKARPKGEKGGKTAAEKAPAEKTPRASAGSKRQSKADRLAAREREDRDHMDVSGEEREGPDAGVLAKKRKRDDGEAGYRPKGGARPVKKKRKSEGGGEGGGAKKRRASGVEKGE
ncbi:uncharacterized protein DNG_09345 [Cephalotrichum gorgonifer]|uniref:Uncharacterized protein n=1 Tax=Cephalotrichum gorgonifer TaxID=2041049 RepID=A0AAE8N7K9_9PEZI|nr:uncharacterized protein DNG_09345 [Cephalotrichum gorgonifer]